MGKKDLKKLQELHQQKFKARIVRVECGDATLDIRVEVTFSQSDIRKYIEKVINRIETAERLRLNIDNITITNMTLLDTFTDFEFPESLEESLIMFDLMMDLEVVEKVFDSFQEDEVKKIQKYVEETLKGIPKILKEIKDNNPDFDITQLLRDDYDERS